MPSDLGDSAPLTVEDGRDDAEITRAADLGFEIFSSFYPDACAVSRPRDRSTFVSLQPDMTHEFAHESGDERLVFWASGVIPEVSWASQDEGDFSISRSLIEGAGRYDMRLGELAAVARQTSGNVLEG